MLEKSSNGFQTLRENYETWTETNVFEKQVYQTLLLKRRYTPEEKYTFKYIEGYYDAKTPTQVLSKFLKVRNMIGKIQDYKLKDVKVKGNDATVTFTSRSVSAYGAAAAVRTSL